MTSCSVETQPGLLCGNPVIGQLDGKDYCAHHGLQAVMAKISSASHIPDIPQPVSVPKEFGADQGE